MPLAAKRLARSCYESTATHRMVPLSVARALVEAKAERMWDRDRARRELAMLHLRFLVGRSSRAAEAESLARAYILETLKRMELRWRPWLTNQQPVEGVERLLELQRAGRGYVISYMHHGEVGGAAPSLGRHGVKLHVPVHWRTMTGAAIHHRQLLRNVTSQGASVFRADGSYGHIRDLLTSGHGLLIAWDMRGSLDSTFLGRSVSTAAGTPRLALECDVPIVPLTVHRDGWHQKLKVEEPIESGNFGTIGALQAEISRRHEPSVLAWPEAMQMPLQRWIPAQRGDFGEFDFAVENIRDLPI